MGLCSRYAGLNTDLFALPKSSIPTIDSSSSAAPEFNWGTSWQPERPARLSSITHHLAQRGLSGEHGRNLQNVDWVTPELDDTTLSPTRKYAIAAMSIARNAPLRILPGELIVGSATLLAAAHHTFPVFNDWSVSHTTIGFKKLLDSVYKALRA